MPRTYIRVIIALSLIPCAILQHVDFNKCKSCSTVSSSDITCASGCQCYTNVMHCRAINQFPYIPGQINNLVLWYDPLPSLEPTTYPHLEELYIDSNNISHVRKYHIENFPGLRSFGVSGGKINCFDSGVFKDLINLVYLSFDANEITKAVIRELPPQIHTINLENNKILTVTFSKRFYENVLRLHRHGSTKVLRIPLSGNPIICGCRFRQILFTLDPLVKFYGKCQYPKAFRGKSFSEIVSNCTKAEEELESSVDLTSVNNVVDFDGYGDACDAGPTMKPMEVRSEAIILIAGSIENMIWFGLMMTFIIIN